VTSEHPSPPLRRFSEVTRVTRTDERTFTADVDRGWAIMGKPNGGYLVAMMARAAAEVSDHDHVIASSAHFLRSPDPGPVEIVVEPLRAGRSTGQSRVSLRRGDDTFVESLVTIGPVSADAEDRWSVGVPQTDVAPYDECIRLVSPPAPEMMQQVDLRIDPATAGFLRGQPADLGELRGWLALPAGEAFDTAGVHFALDAFPPGTFDVEMSGWVPTLELTTYVRGLPAPGPLRVLQKARLVRDGRLDEACFVWDSEGRLVGSSTQLAMIRI
jgi:acyl-coenzyme A thioesterase PaaI-like protein